MNDSEKKQQAALVSVAVKVLLAVGKLVAGLLSGSLALLSEAANNIGDIAIVLFSYFSIRVASKPADEKHHYGYAKVEALAALVQTGFLFGLAVYICATAIEHLLSGAVNVVPSALSFGVLIVSILVDGSRWYSLDKIAKETRSEALAADALNFASDIVAASFALLGLIAVHFGYWQGDAIGALGVAAFITYAGFNLATRTIQALTDTAPPGLTEKISAIVHQTPGILSIDTLRLRPSGGEVLGDITIVISRTLTHERVTAIRDNLKQAISREFPEVSMMIETMPIAIDNETIVERVFLIAAKRSIPIHHLTVQEVAGRTSVSFDVEIDGRIAYGEAHEIVARLEEEVRDELGSDIEIETHVEPLEPRELEGRDTLDSVRSEIAEALVKRAKLFGAISDVHDVRVRETSAGLVVNYHCRVDPALSVGDVHNYVDDLDHMAQADFASIVRIVGHAEPLKA